MRVLCLSFWTPPAIRPQAILIGKMLPEWRKQGIDPVVITYESEQVYKSDFPVYSIPRFSCGGSGLLGRVKRAIYRTRYFRDLKKRVVAICAEHDIDVIFSFSNPQDSNILGAMLKKMLKRPFVSHFSDPWIDNPYKTFSGMGGILEKKREAFVMKQSDSIIFTNEAAKKLVMSKYPASFQEKALVVPHCYSEYPAPAKSGRSQFVLSHIGAFYKQRTPSVLFDSLNRMLREKPELREQVRVHLIGASNPYSGYGKDDVMNLVKKYDLADIVLVSDPVSYETSLEYMTLADCLIAIDANYPDSPFLPSKVIDYVGSGSAIIAITPHNSPTAAVLSRVGYRSFSYSEAEALAVYMAALIRGDEHPIRKDHEAEIFHVRNTTARYVSLFHTLRHLHV